MERTSRPSHCPHCECERPDWQHQLWECSVQPGRSDICATILSRAPALATSCRGMVPHSMNWDGIGESPEHALAHFLQELVARKDRWLLLTPLAEIPVEDDSAGPPPAPRAKRQNRPRKPTAAEKREAEAAAAS
eukprot:6057912-Amphidinium_carterae.1